MRVWFLNKMIWLCTQAMKYTDGADDQNEINEMISMKNYFMRQRIKLITKGRG